MRRLRGTTLIELLIACALAALVLTGLSTLVVQAVHYQRALEVSLSLQQQSLSVIARLTRELSEASPAGLRVEPEGVIFSSPRNAAGRIQVGPDGRLLWSKVVCFYRETVAGESCLVRKEESLLAPGDGPAPLPPHFTVAHFQGDGRPGTVVGREIANFQVTGSRPLSLKLGVVRVVRNQTYRIESQTDVLPKN